MAILRAVNVWHRILKGLGLARSIDPPGGRGLLNLAEDRRPKAPVPVVEPPNLERLDAIWVAAEERAAMRAPSLEQLRQLDSRMETKLRRAQRPQ
jgi:hypothetical protein